MRYVYIFVALGLLVLGTGSTYTAVAADGEMGHLISYNQDSPLIVTINTTQEIEKAHEAYVALKEEERRKREAEEKRQRAIEQLGPWGPDIVAAAEMYGQDPYAMYRVMTCESKGDQYAVNTLNGICKGLFQFDPGTWAGTPFGGTDIFNGQAQVYATAWMWSQGRKGEWSCI